MKRPSKLDPRLQLLGEELTIILSEERRYTPKQIKRFF